MFIFFAVVAVFCSFSVTSAGGNDCSLDNTNFPDGNMLNADKPDLAACVAWCRATAGCVAVSYGKIGAGANEGKCFLKNNKHQAADDRIEYISMTMSCQDNTNFPDGNMLNADKPDLAACAAWCRDTAGCVAVSYGKIGANEGKCFLKNDEHKAADHRMQYTSINLDCRLDNTNFPAGNMLNATKPDLAACAAWCRAITGCVAVSYGKTGGNEGKCFLKNNKHHAGDHRIEYISMRMTCQALEQAGSAGGEGGEDKKEKKKNTQWCEYKQQYLTGYSSGDHRYYALEDAKNQCLKRSDCGGVTKESNNNYNKFTLRRTSQLKSSKSGEVSYKVC